MPTRRKRHNSYAFSDIHAIKRRNWTVMLFISVLIIVLTIIGRLNPQKNNFNREKLKVRHHFRLIGSALERYKVDNGLYPLVGPGLYSGSELWVLTTPHPYLWNFDELKDPFPGKGYRVAIIDSSPSRWVLMSAGPDGVWDLSRLPSGLEVSRNELPQYLSRWQYDPTNGPASGGDLLRIGK